MSQYLGTSSEMSAFTFLAYIGGNTSLTTVVILLCSVIAPLYLGSKFWLLFVYQTV